ncbi:MAG TPA: hypothetical protein VKZ78_00970 [Sphingobacteriaceae bacterium]|nr:hypothetical protein [Sphingobacteriaceae bacterium]
MKKVKITPLVLAIAVLLSWLLWQVWFAELSWSQGLFVLLLFVILVAADQYFRLLYRQIQKLWLIEGVFLVLVFVVAWLLNRYI